MSANSWNPRKALAKAAEEASKAAQEAYNEEAAKVKQLQEELAATRQNRDQLSSRLLEDQGEIQELKQVNEELSRLRQAREQLNSRLTERERDAAISARRSETLEVELSKSNAELARAKAQLQSQQAVQAAQGSTQAEFSGQLASAKAAAEKAAAALRERLTGAPRWMRKWHGSAKRGQLNTKLAREEQAAADLRQRTGELERKLAHSTAELERVKGELDKQVIQRNTVESHLRATKRLRQGRHRTGASTSPRAVVVVRRFEG